MSTEVLPGTPELTVQRDVPCPLADGTTSYTDIYRPAGDEALPALVISTPYNKGDAESNVGFAHPSWYARQGFLVVTHDVRGRYRSEGTFEPFFNEGADVAHLIEWVSRLERCNGRVATYGFSYPGLNQLLAAQKQPDGLAAIAPAFTAGSPYREWFYNQGALGLAFAASWANFLALDTAAQRGDDAALAQLGASLADSPKWYWVLPLNIYPPLADGHAPYFFDWLGHPTFDEFWREIEVDHARIEQPGLHVGGWYDVFVRGTVRNFVELSKAGHAPQKLRDRPLASHAVEASRWRISGRGPHRRRRLARALLERDAEERVLGCVRRSCERVPDGRQLARGRHVAAECDDTNRLVPPQRGARGVVLRRRAAHPERARGRTSGRLHLPSRRTCAERGGPLVLRRVDRTHGPSGPVRARGFAPGARLHLRGARGGVASARRCRVPPLCQLLGPRYRLLRTALPGDGDGVSMNLTEGIVRARFRESLSDPTPIEPGRVYEYVIDMGPVGARLAAGERLRVSVSSSDFPLYDRNLNTGGPLYGEPASAEQLATQSVLHDAEHPSRITLPVFRP